MEYSEQDFLDLCKTKIEGKYHLRNSARRLKQRDFEYLIDLIEETSGIKLSVSTLKRLWREKTGHNPHPATLDALVSILGFKDWLDFKIQTAPQEEKPGIPTEASPAPKTTLRKRSPFLITTAALGMIGLVILIIIAFTSRNSGHLSGAGDVLFSINNTVSTGVPNTVIFNYDVNTVQADTFYIQQDWNPNNIKKIDPSAGYFTSVYYLPGFHRARLIADGTILKTQEVFIRTEGWLATALYSFDEPPVYLPADSSQDGMLSIREEDVRNSRVDTDRLGGIWLFNIGDFGNLDGHNFRSETRFRFRELTSTPCPAMQFTIHTEANIYFLQLTTKGCVGGLELLIGETFVSGSDNDLSAFGTDVYRWQELALTVEDKQATVFLNGKAIFESGFNEDFGTIVGVDYRFNGLGDVDYLRLSSIDGTLVYEEDF